MIIDEAHHAAAAGYQRVIDHVDADLVLGVTATPERHDGKSLEKTFEELVFARSIEEMIADGYLVAPIGKRISVDVDLSEVKVTAGDFQGERPWPRPSRKPERRRKCSRPTSSTARIASHSSSRRPSRWPITWQRCFGEQVSRPRPWHGPPRNRNATESFVGSTWGRLEIVCKSAWSDRRVR